MSGPDPTPTPAFGYTDSVGTILYVYEGLGEKPTDTKVDPSTIQWPEGVPKPWEESKTEPEGPEADQ